MENKMFDQEALLAEIMEISRSLDQLNYYELLRIDRKTPFREAKKAYFELARRFHPDLFSRDIDSETRDKVAEVFDRINKAFQTIADGPKREAYDKRLEFSKESEQQTSERKAEALFSKGQSLYSQGRYEEAVTYLTQAVKIKENNPRYILLRAKAEAKVPIFLKKAESDFQKVIRMEPWNPEGLIGIGRLYKEAGLPLRAEKYFAQALNLDPKNTEAAKELKDSRHGKKTTLKDIFSLGKKKK